MEVYFYDLLESGLSSNIKYNFYQEAVCPALSCKNLEKQLVKRKLDLTRS
jgi:hypothetical protein